MPPSDNPDVGSNKPAKARARPTPQDDARLESEARALFEAGDPSAALSMLDSRRVIMLARHEAAAPLPCLCKRCLLPNVAGAESAGVAYVRDFVVAQRRALFYWAPQELSGDAKRVRASMRSELRLRLLSRRRPQQARPRRSVDPFTGRRVL